MRKFFWAQTALGCLLLAGGCQPAAGPAVKPPTTPVVSPFRISTPPETNKGKANAGSNDSLTTRTFRFVDVHESAGLQHTYLNGGTGRLLMVEATGGGCGWLDFDGDLHWDLYCNQGGDPQTDSLTSQPSDKLFRAVGDGTFLDVTEVAGIADFYYSQGVAVGDYDNDGFDDVYVTNIGRNTLYHNLGDGTFQDVSAETGVGDERWSSSAAWADVDRDGDLDLYVCNYTLYDPRNPVLCDTKDGRHAICHPKDVAPVPDEFYLNQGDGTFVPQAQVRGLFGEGNRGLGVIVADFDNDGWPDIYVANDTTENFLFLNDGRAHFREVAGRLGCAVDRNGSPQASMGLACGDFDGNGYLDIYSTHFFLESNTLYQNFGLEGFQDVTGIMKLHAPTMSFLGFGTVMQDFDQDGFQELFVANGHIEPYDHNGTIVYEMEPQLFSFHGKWWVEYSRQAGEYFQHKYLGRGVASCDYDEDGDLDLCVIHQNGPAAILRNECPRGHGLKLRFLGWDSNRRGVGVRVTVQAGDKSYLQELAGGTSYVSSHQPVLVFGFGAWDQPCRVTLQWPSGRTQILEDVLPDQSLVVEEPRDAK